MLKYKMFFAPLDGDCEVTPIFFKDEPSTEELEKVLEVGIGDRIIAFAHSWVADAQAFYTVRNSIQECKDVSMQLWISELQARYEDGLEWPKEFFETPDGSIPTFEEWSALMIGEAQELLDLIPIA